jgi:putative hemolysin
VIDERRRSRVEELLHFCRGTGSKCCSGAEDCTDSQPERGVLTTIEFSAVDRRCDAEPHFSVSIAKTRADVREAQNLRYRVFVEEMGAQIGATRSALERDRFDPFCDHLVVRDRRRGLVIGTYRLLTPDRAVRAGAYMAEREFDLSSLLSIRESAVELGRACIDPAYRGGTALMLLWSCIARHTIECGGRYLFGCASVPADDGGVNANRVFDELNRQHAAPPEYRVAPRSPLAPPLTPNWAPATIPPLLKGYMHLGAWVCGAPALDPQFHTADFLVLLSLERVRARYARHFLQRPVPVRKALRAGSRHADA